MAYLKLGKIKRQTLLYDEEKPWIESIAKLCELPVL